jgi:hypothetical protein
MTVQRSLSFALFRSESVLLKENGTQRDHPSVLIRAEAGKLYCTYRSGKMQGFRRFLTVFIPIGRA